MSNLQLTTQVQNGIHVIRATGYLDGEGGETLRLAVEAAFAQGSQRFLLNFISSPVINSQGISIIFQVVEMIVDQHRGRVAFVGLSKTAFMVFRNVGLLGFGNAFDTEAEALKELA